MQNSNKSKINLQAIDAALRVAENDKSEGVEFPVWYEPLRLLYVSLKDSPPNKIAEDLFLQVDSLEMKRDQLMEMLKEKTAELKIYKDANRTMAALLASVLSCEKECGVSTGINPVSDVLLSRSLKSSPDL